MTGHIDIIAYLENDLTPTEIQNVDEHLEMCPQCREALNLFKSSLEMNQWCHQVDEELQKEDPFELEMYAEKDWSELPGPILKIIAEKKNLRTRAIDCLSALVTTALRDKIQLDRQDISSWVASLVDRLSVGDTGQVASFAYSQERTDACRDDFEIRQPPFPTNLQIQMDDYTVVITHTEAGTRIRTMRSGKKKEGSIVTFGHATGEKRTLHTNANGEIII